jgi:hypothetical protein
MKSIYTLIPDIYDLFKSPHEVTEEHIESFKQDVGNAVKQALSEAGTTREAGLRMSNIGTKDRRLWMDKKYGASQDISPQNHIKFLFGHMLEALLVLLAKEAGHSVTDQQTTLDIDGVPGHSDGKFDGVPLDLKSASTYAFTKYKKGGVLRNDQWGYAYQLGAYDQADTKEHEECGWLIIDKQHGELFLDLYDPVEMPNAKERIKELREVLESNTEPPLCEEPYTDNQGNTQIAKGCTYCPHKTKCFLDMRVFRYSTNDAFYIDLKKEPRVKEVTDEYFSKN